MTEPKDVKEPSKLPQFKVSDSSLFDWNGAPMITKQHKEKCQKREII